jgi:hypothetical protein
LKWKKVRAWNEFGTEMAEMHSNAPMVLKEKEKATKLLPLTIDHSSLYQLFRIQAL